MIVKIINIQVISIYESILVCNIIHVTFYLKKIPSKIIKVEEIFHNMIQKQLLTILKSVLKRSIGYVLFRKYTLHD